MPDRNSQVLTIPSSGEGDIISKKEKKGNKVLSSRELSKKKLERVPDETMHLMDTICGLDTGYILLCLGVFKLILVVPLLVLGVVLISIRIAEFDSLAIVKPTPSVLGLYNDDIYIPTLSYDEVMAKYHLMHTLHSHGGRFGNDSIAPLWTAVMVFLILLLAASAATDFVAIWKRHGSTIVLYMLVSTVAFVAGILCIEYDRLEIEEIHMIYGDNSTDLKLQLYLTCVVFASIGVATGIVTIYVGTRMAALEQRRLYMERDGLEAILTKNKNSFPRTIGYFLRRISCIQGTDTPTSSEIDIESTMSNDKMEGDKQTAATQSYK